MTNWITHGVDPSEFGTWCKHGKHLLVIDPADTSPYPSTIPANPWPCAEPECTPEALQEEFAEEAREYAASQWAEYEATIQDAWWGR